MSGLQLRGHWLTPDRGRELVVLGPSLGTGVVALWDRCAQVLASTADVDILAWDLPGHGDGPPEQGPFSTDDLAVAVTRLVDTVRPDAPFVHAGVSVAGIVGLALATGQALSRAGLDPARVRGSAVICSDAVVGTTASWTERADLVRRAGTPVMVEGSVQRWFAPGFLERAPRDATALLTTLQHADKDSYARVCEALGAADYRAELATITIPVYVMGGRHDSVCTPEQEHALAAAIPGAALAIIEDAAHLAPAEQPEEVGARLAEWIEATRSGEGATPTIEGSVPTAAGASATTTAAPGQGAGEVTAAQRHEAGMSVRRQVLSDEHVDRADARTTPLTEDFQDLITRYAWGEIWTRPGLDRRTRSAITLTALIALGHWGELELHLRAARRNGLTDAEISEVLLQSAIYCGVPAANHAFAVAQRVLEQEGP